MNNWHQTSIGEFISFNPPEKIVKGAKSRKIPMDQLGVFQRKINGSEISEYSAGPKFRNGDTLVAKITPCLENGKTAFVDILDDNEVAFGSSEFIVLRENELSHKEFIYYLARSPLFREKAISCMEGTSGRKRVNEAALKRQEILVPEKKVQEQIASVLSVLDRKIELNNRINNNLEQIAKAIYDYWFVQFDFPNEEGQPYKSSGGEMAYDKVLKRKIPKGWEVKTLEELIDVKDGTHDSPKYVEIGYPLITSKNLDIGGINFSATNKISKSDFDAINLRSRVHTGDILFSMIGSIGTIYKVEETVIDFAIKNVALFKTSQKENLKNYIFQYLHSYDMQRYIPNVISGSIQKFIGLTSLRQTPVLFNEKLIKLFNKNTHGIYSKMNINLKQNKELISLRDWLLPLLMNGQIKVAEAYNDIKAIIGIVADEEASQMEESKA